MAIARIARKFPVPLVTVHRCSFRLYTDTLTACPMIHPVGSEIQTVEGVTIIRPREEFSSLFENLLDDAGITVQFIDSAGSTKFVIDLQNVKFIGSAFLGRCILLQKTLQAREGGRLALCGMNTFTKAAMSLAALDKIIAVFESSDEALRAVT